MKEKLEREVQEKSPIEAVRDDLSGRTGEAAQESHKAKPSETQQGGESAEQAVEEHWQSK